MRRIYHLIYLPIFLILFSNASIAQTIIPDGPVSGTWPLEASPYLIQGNIEIPDDSTLTIDPGVIIEFQGHYGLSVQGILLAEGTETDTIIFTMNDTTGFNDLSSNLGGWNGINIIDPDTTNDSTIINYCKFEFAKAVGDVWYLNAGGAFTILNFDKVHISNSLFQNNSAGGDTNDVPSGGAIHLAWSDIKLENNKFSNNRAQVGGAVQFHESSPTFINNTFINNYASHGSGAIDVGSKSSPTFSGDQISNNFSRYNGGGISFWDSTVTLLDSVIISNNLSRDGSGTYSNNSELILSNCTINNNRATGLGGGIHSYMSELTFNSCIFSQDTAIIFGGGINADQSTLTFNNCNFLDNHSDFQSGAINAWKCNLTIMESDFINNSSEINYGAIGADSCLNIIDNCFFESNQSIWGGGLAVNYGMLQLINSQFISNSSEHGGALLSGWNDNTITNVHFEENFANWGGAMSITNSHLDIIDCAFLNNHADEAGAFEYIADTANFQDVYNVNISGSTFMENSANGAVGTFRFVQNYSEFSLVKLNVDDCTIINNSADRVNILISGFIKDFKLSNSIISSNSTSRRTAGCNFTGNTKGIVENCIMSSNLSLAGSSAASVGLNSNVALINCTVVNNYGENGAAITLRNNGKLQLINSILWNNEPYNTTLTAVTDSTPCVLDIYYSDVQYSLDSILINDSISIVNWAEGNLDANPLFLDSLSDFQLMDHSPCIGSGIDSLTISDTRFYSPFFDIEGNPRPNPESSKPDIGAYENEYGIPTDIEIIDNIPTAYTLFQNYPNPFNPSTTIKYSLPTDVRYEEQDVRLVIFDILGSEVASLVNQKQKPGNYKILFDANDLPSGVYIYMFKTDNYVKVRKMLLLK